MPDQSREVRPHSKARHALSKDGTILRVPDQWSLLSPGDAALTRRVKAAVPTWTVMEKAGRRTISKGIWADTETIEHHRLKLLIERASPTYQKKLEAGRNRRVKQQGEYVEDFNSAVLDFLNFPSLYQEIASKLATQITEHATPVGSGTVARTKRIPVEQRAEAATIAWMRHQTTAYDSMHIPLVKGQRRETRRLLAQKSKTLLNAYRVGNPINSENCPLQKALSKSE